MKTKLTQEYLKEALHYNPETGIFNWNERPLSHFKSNRYYSAWNKRFMGKNCESIEHGYVIIGIGGKKYFAHRLAFLYIDGYLPENFVDHIDRNRMNNKWLNLREVTVLCNAQNCNLAIDNTSGVTGVSWVDNRKKWVAQIRVNKKSKNLGRFDNFEDAVWARYNEEVNNPLWTCSVDSLALKYLKENNLI